METYDQGSDPNVSDSELSKEVKVIFHLGDRQEEEDVLKFEEIP